jgi:restriction endonuclease
MKSFNLKEEDVFEVHSIKGMKLKGEKIYFLIEWEGYKGQDTWEPLGHLSLATKLKHFKKLYSKLQRWGRYKDTDILVRLIGEVLEESEQFLNQ